MAVEGIPDEQITQMLGAMSMSAKAVVMKVEPGKADQGPSQGGVQDVVVQDAQSDSDSEDEH
eukprot:12219271-Alexandrium_andersonii.AAC.1